MTRSGARPGGLLRWAITGKLPVIGYVTVPDTAPLLSQAQLALCVPRTLSTSCDQAVFVDHATDASVSPDVVSLKIDRFG